MRYVTAPFLQRTQRARLLFLQQRVQSLFGGCGNLDELRYAIGAAAVHPVQRQAMQVNVQVRRRAEALNQRHRAAPALAGNKPRRIQQAALEHALHHAQHRRDPLGTAWSARGGSARRAAARRRARAAV
jgi:hypothetical protein